MKVKCITTEIVVEEFERDEDGIITEKTTTTTTEQETEDEHQKTSE